MTLFLALVMWYVWGLHSAFSDTQGQRSPNLLFAQEHHSAKIEVDVNLVLLPVTVTDRAGGIVAGLERSHFSVYEEKQLQQISYFEHVDTPFSVGVVFDVSGSMKERAETARDALTALFRHANAEDEAFLLTFSATSNLEVAFTKDLEQIRFRALMAQIDGQTAMVDALFEALSEMKRAQNLRRAIVLISDAGGNRSVHTKQELLRQAVEADVRIYPVIVDFKVANREQRLGRAFLEKLANRTGGRCFMVKRNKSMVDAMDKLGRLLHNHYLIGYYPRREAPEGKWQRVRVRLEADDLGGKLRTDAPSGYYRPSGNALN
jgi:Ca-activated chloride channel family protein